MAKPIVPMPTSRRIQTICYDEKGREFVVIEFAEDEMQLPDGSVLERKQAPNVLLCDGTLWNPSMARGDKPVLLCQCDVCRQPRLGKGANGLITQERAKTCSDCGRVICLRHARRSHGRWRCPTCQRRYQVTSPIRSFLRWVFFETEDE